MSLQTSVPWLGHRGSLHTEPRSAGRAWPAAAAPVPPCTHELVCGEGSALAVLLHQNDIPKSGVLFRWGCSCADSSNSEINLT